MNLALAPAFVGKSILARNYDSFLDFVLISRDTNVLTKQQYLDLAQAANINFISDIFKTFPMKDFFSQGKLALAHVYIGNRHSSIFVEGDKP